MLSNREIADLLTWFRWKTLSSQPYKFRGIQLAICALRLISTRCLRQAQICV